jgi:hypothetical protein
MSALELDGYLIGVIVMPQAVPIRRSAWVARLWGDHAAAAPTVSAAKHLER